MLSRSPTPTFNWCESCGTTARMISIAEAALVAGLSQRAIFQVIEAGRVHFVELKGGSLLVCLESLLNQA